MKTVPLADVLWTAANKHLESRNGLHLEYSCCAVGAALGLDYIFGWSDVNRHPASAFLRDLGCDVCSLYSFDGFTNGPERQGVRYMWLLLAMHVAESEGIMVEVT